MICLNRTEPKAAKEHRCIWCLEPINPGDRYESSTWVDGDRLWTQKAHLPCVDVLMRYAAYYALECDDPVDWADVLEWVSEEAS